MANNPATQWPAMQYPSPTPYKADWTPQADPVPPSEQIVQPTPVAQTWAATSPPTNVQTVKDPAVTQAEIYTEFGIVNAQILTQSNG